MFVTYPAYFYYSKQDAVHFFVTFPDFNLSATQGTDVANAMYMASDWLGINVADLVEHERALPTPSAMGELSLTDNPFFNDDADLRASFDATQSFVSMVGVNIDSYLNQSQPIKKTLTIPKWANDRGKKLHINFSETLTEAIANLPNPHSLQK